MFFGLLAFAAIILAWIALSQIGELRQRISVLERELARLERERTAVPEQREAAVAQAGPVEREEQAAPASIAPLPAVPSNAAEMPPPPPVPVLPAEAAPEPSVIAPPPLSSGAAIATPPPIMATTPPELSGGEVASLPLSPQATPAAGRGEPTGKSSFEMRLGTYWLVRVGIVMLLTGLVFFGNYAYENFIVRLGPAGKLALLYLAGGALLGLGTWWQRQGEKPGLRNYGQVLFAGGLAAVYFTTYAAHYVKPLRVIDSAVLAGTLLLAWAAFIGWIADRRKSEILAVFGVGLAYYSSIITRVGAFTLYSNLLLTAAVVGFLVRNRWAGLSFASLVATYVGYGFWRFFVGGNWVWQGADQSLGFGMVFLALYWAAFSAATFLSKAERLTGQTRALFLTLNNGAYFTLCLLTLRQAQADWFWLFALMFGAVLLGLAELAKRVLADDPLAKSTYLTQGLLLVTLGLISKFAGLQLALVLGAESVTLYILGTQRRSLILQWGSGIAATLAVLWALQGLGANHDTGDVWLGAGLGGLLVVNAWWAHRQYAEQTELFRAVPGYFAALAMGVWLAVTIHHAKDVALGLAVEGLAITFSIYLLRVRELTLLAQLFALGAQLTWVVNSADTAAPAPWWKHGVITAISFVLGHWWQRQRALKVAEDFQTFWLIGYALAAAGLVFVWLHPLVSVPVWLALTTLLALGFTVYGVLTRWWWVAAAGQLFLGASVLQFAEQLQQSKPAWYLPLAPVFAVGFLAVATARWLTVRPSGSARVQDVLLLLARWYRWAAVIMSIRWVFAYIAAREQTWVLGALGILAFAVAGWRRNREILIFSVIYTAVGLFPFNLSRLGVMPVYWPNLLAILALLGQQQVARRQADRYSLPERAHTLAILVGNALLWWFLSRAVTRGGGGFLLTASWSGLALVLFGCGVILRERMYRWAGLAVLGAALARVVLVDVWRQPTLYRVLTFMALGVVLMVLGFVYNKHQEKIRKWL